MSRPRGVGYLGPDLSAVEAIGWFIDGRNQRFHAIIVHEPSCDKKEDCDRVITRK